MSFQFSVLVTERTHFVLELVVTIAASTTWLFPRA